MSSPALKSAIDNLSVGPKGQKSQLEVMGSMSTTSGAHVMLSCHYKRGKQWLPTPPYWYQKSLVFFLEPSLADSNTTNSPWPFTSLEIMDSDTIHATDLWVKA